MKPAPAKSILQLAVGQQYNGGKHCWRVLDDLFNLWPHFIASAGFLTIAAASYLNGGSTNLGWLLFIVVAHLVFRWAFKLAYTYRSRKAPLRRWLNLFWVTAMTSGGIWGLCVAVMLQQASASIQLMGVTLGCAIIQSATIRAYMAPLAAFSQSLIVIAIVGVAAMLDGIYVVAPLALLLILFQVSQVRNLIGLRVSELHSRQERTAALEQLAQKAAALQRANAQLHHYALTDGLTGLPNRRKFDRHLSRALRKDGDEENCLSLAILDVDHFKRFNDTYGHLAGDSCLAMIGSALKAFADTPDLFVARYGGEEFAMIMTSTDADGAADHTERLRQKIAAMDMSQITRTSQVLTVSIGTATRNPGDLITGEGLIGRADAGLYEAKRAGRNRVCSGDTLVPTDNKRRRA